MSRSADTHTPMPIVSHVIMRGARARRALCGAGSRAIAALAMLAVLVGAHSITRLEHGASGDAFWSPSAATSIAALHSAPTHRPAFVLRSSTRWPSSTDVLSLVHLQDLASWTPAHRVAIAPAIGRSESGPARGYDATAPPALS